MPNAPLQPRRRVSADLGWKRLLGLFPRNELNNGSHTRMAFSLGNFPVNFAQNYWPAIRELPTELISCH